LPHTQQTELLALTRSRLSPYTQLRDGALRESLRQQVIAQADRYNGYDVINGDISNEQVSHPDN
jgi:hypothetical protein